MYRFLYSYFRQYTQFRRLRYRVHTPPQSRRYLLYKHCYRHNQATNQHKPRLDRYLLQYMRRHQSMNCHRPFACAHIAHSNHKNQPYTDHCHRSLARPSVDKSLLHNDHRRYRHYHHRKVFHRQPQGVDIPALGHMYHWYIHCRHRTKSLSHPYTSRSGSSRFGNTRPHRCKLCYQAYSDWNMTLMRGHILLRHDIDR